MEANSLAALATSMARQQVGDAVAISVLKKAIDTQAAAAATLLDAIPSAPSSNPPHLGNHIDTAA